MRVLRCRASECDIVAGGAFGSGDTQLSNPAGVTRFALRHGGRDGHSWKCPTELRNPNDIALTPDGDCVVADTGNHRIQRCPAATTRACVQHSVTRLRNNSHSHGVVAAETVFKQVAILAQGLGVVSVCCPTLIRRADGYGTHFVNDKVSPLPGL